MQQVKIVVRLRDVSEQEQEEKFVLHECLLYLFIFIFSVCVCVFVFIRSSSFSFRWLTKLWSKNYEKTLHHITRRYTSNCALNF